jgi:hypothetical protein
MRWRLTRNAVSVVLGIEVGHGILDALVMFGRLMHGGSCGAGFTRTRSRYGSSCVAPSWPVTRIVMSLPASLS